MRRHGNQLMALSVARNPRSEDCNMVVPLVDVALSRHGTEVSGSGSAVQQNNEPIWSIYGDEDDVVSVKRGPPRRLRVAQRPYGVNALTS